MSKVLWIVVVFVGFWPSLAAAGPTTEPGLFEPFDPAQFEPSDIRLLQTALAAEGDYTGPLDGTWGGGSQDALATYAWREFAETPVNLHASALVITFLAAIEEAGWTPAPLDGLGITMALPEHALTPPKPEDGGTRRWSRSGSLTLLTHRFDGPTAHAWHEVAVTANADPAAFHSAEGPDRLVTGGRLADGRAYFTRSDRVGDHWATVFLASGADEAQMFNLMRASLGPGEPAPWTLARDGALQGLVEATLALVASMGADGPTPERTALPPQATTTGTGTGFFVSDRVIVTAQHVVAGCASVELADGTPLALLAEDAGLDVAALASPGGHDVWLRLAPDAEARLGQQVHAMGFPYYGITGTSLHLTGGNVSALVGVNDDGRFFSFTAPVQPGNSGGPLIGADGSVLGIVVSRLSEHYIAEATGSLPQNVNYALGQSEIATFLESAGIPAAAGGVAGFDLAKGAPEGFEAAVVPVICR